MKKIFLKIFVICTYFSYSQSEIQVEYSLLYDKSKFENKPDDSFESREIREKILKAQDYVSYTLIGNNSTGVFFTNEFMFDDNSDIMLKAIVGTNEKYFYFDLINEQIIEKRKFLDKTYLLNQEIIKWEITSESKTIQNFTCYKAIAYFEFENEKYPEYAWFTPEIPHKIGPELCINLPGLVLEYQTSKFSIVAKSIKYKIDDKIKEKLIKPNGKNVTNAEFDKIVLEARGEF